MFLSNTLWYALSIDYKDTISQNKINLYMLTKKDVPIYYVKNSNCRKICIKF